MNRSQKFVVILFLTDTHTQNEKEKKNPMLSDGTRGIFFLYFFFYSFLFSSMCDAVKNENTYRVCASTYIRRKIK